MDVRLGAALAAAMMVLAGCTAEPDPAPPPDDPAPIGPFTLDGAPLPAPTGLRLLFGGAAVDVDTAAVTPEPVTGWLPLPGHAPLLIEERRTDLDVGAARVETRDGVVRLTAPTLAVPAAALDGAGVWLTEYADRTACTLREVALDGRDRRPARPVTCGTRPIAETPHGLWVDIGPDAFVAATVGTSPDQHRAALLDPATLAEKVSYARVHPIDDDRVLVLGDRWELRDLRTGAVTPLERPPARGWPDPHVGALSPDRRHLPFTFGEPGNAPQIMDVWLLALDTAAWTRLPLMPVYAALKGTDLAWAADGRLVLVGRFPERGLVATWRTGDAGYLVRPFDRPAAAAGAPVDTRFLVR
jgi:hypothetical protein